MKKLLLIVFTLTMTQSTFGQSLFNGIKERLSFGLKVGGNYSNFTNADFGTEGITDFHGGLIVNFRLSDTWSIQEDFLFSSQGAKIKDANVFGGKEDLKLSYMSVPILVKYHSNIGLYAELGGQANLLIEDAKNTGYENFANKVDAGAVAGFGYQFKNGAVNGLGIGARYYHGLRGVGNFSSSTINPDFKNSTVQVSVFYMLR